MHLLEKENIQKRTIFLTIDIMQIPHKSATIAFPAQITGHRVCASRECFTLMTSFCDCGREATHFIHVDGYCDECIDIASLQHFRTITYASVFSLDGKLLSGASSLSYCAERRALLKLENGKERGDVPFYIVVCRVQKDKKRRYTFFNSKPCTQCVF